jgi:glycine dehydrogenase
MAGMFAVYHGPKGLQYIADKVHGMASTLADALNKLGVYQTNTAFRYHCRKTDAKKIRTIAEKNEINFFYIDDETISISLNETTLQTLTSNCCFAEAVGKKLL